MKRLLCWIFGHLATYHPESHAFEPRMVYEGHEQVELREGGERICGFVTSGADYCGALDGTHHCGIRESQHSRVRTLETCERCGRERYAKVSWGGGWSPR